MRCRSARAELETTRGRDADSVVVETLRIEVQYELALAWRHTGNLNAAVALFRRAADMSTELAAWDDED